MFLKPLQPESELRPTVNVTSQFSQLSKALGFLVVVGWLFGINGHLVVAQSLQRGGANVPTSLPGWSTAYPAPSSDDSQIEPSDPSNRMPIIDDSVRRQIGLMTGEQELGEQDSRLIHLNDQRLDDNSRQINRDPLQATSDIEELSTLLTKQTDSLTSREGLGSSIKVALLLAVLSLAPAVVLMSTCYVRVVVVLTLLRQALGSQQLPPMQVLTALSLFITLLVMAPVWNQVKNEAIDPYMQEENPITWQEAWDRGVVPVKKFMANQIVASGNTKSIAMFYQYLPTENFANFDSTSASMDASPRSPTPSGLPESIDDVPLNVLLPAFLVSELKVAFLLGFQIYLPFLVLDLVVSSVTVSTGMLMLPPTMVSFPLKLILFVMVDGWNLVIGMLLQSFVPYT